MIWTYFKISFLKTKWSSTIDYIRNDPVNYYWLMIDSTRDLTLFSLSSERVRVSIRFHDFFPDITATRYCVLRVFGIVYYCYNRDKIVVIYAFIEFSFLYILWVNKIYRSRFIAHFIWFYFNFIFLVSTPDENNYLIILFITIARVRACV